MKDYCLELARAKTNFNEKLNAVREYLQAYTLRLCHDLNLFQHWAFVGGTALRFLYQLPRFSEDLDFSLAKKGYSFLDAIQKIKNELALAGYQASISYHEVKTVQSAMIKFEGLMYEAGLSPLRSQKLGVKLKIDTNPPEGAQLKTEIVNKFFPIAFLSYEISSLFSGKICALLTRKYIKGRDYYDAGWYLSRWKNLSPNIAMLQNALRQMGWSEAVPTEENWRDFLFRTIEKTDWRKVVEDVENFLEFPNDMSIFTRENLLRLIRQE